MAVRPQTQQRTIDRSPIGLGGVEYGGVTQLVPQTAPGEGRPVGRQLEVEADPLVGYEEPRRGVGGSRGGSGAAADGEVFGRRSIARGGPLELHPHVAQPLLVTELARPCIVIPQHPQQQRPHRATAGEWVHGVGTHHPLHQEGKEQGERIGLARAVGAAEDQASVGKAEHLVVVLPHVADARPVWPPPIGHLIGVCLVVGARLAHE